MALTALAISTAEEILREVIPDLRIGILLFEEDSPVRPGWIRTSSPKEDGGFESIFTDVVDITEEQLELFNKLRKKLSNSPIQKSIGNGITRIGWL